MPAFPGFAERAGSIVANFAITARSPTVPVGPCGELANLASSCKACQATAAGIKKTMNPSTIEIVATAIFAIAVLHTFATAFFERLARKSERHSGLFHLMAEVEAVFGFWALVLFVTVLFLDGKSAAVRYLEGLSFREPMFVFAIMVVAASRPILEFATATVRLVARTIPARPSTAFYFSVLAVVPLLGSFITEPAAMTLAALMLLKRYYSQGISRRLMYATLGVLFVNVSIGGVLTPFAAPPVVMVAATWGWDISFMLQTFGWKAAIAVVVNALFVTLIFRRELSGVRETRADETAKMPVSITVVHLAFLTGIVIFAHHTPIFMGLLLFFLGFTQAYEQYQSRLMLREALMVGFFLAGLVTLGGLQQWWLQPALTGLSPTTLYYSAAALTAVTDNAALTYLGSLVQGISPEFKYSLVAGAVTGGGLTVIANAPNPAGFAILQGSFSNGRVNPVGLFVSALAPTAVAIFAFQFL